MHNEVKSRYKLQEAAEILAAQGEAVNFEKLLRNLRSSVLDSSLKVYQPNSEISYEPSIDKESCMRTDSELFQSGTGIFFGGITWVDVQYDEQLRRVFLSVFDDLEAYWNDLNDWVEKNEPQINYKFQNPSICVKELSGITREPGCREHILKYWPEIKRTYGDHPNGYQVLCILKRHKDEIDRLPEQKTVQNCLADLRKKKKIP